MLLENQLYVAYPYSQHVPISVYDLSSLSQTPNLDSDRPEDSVEPVCTTYCCRHSICNPLFIPFYRGDSTCVLFKTNLGIVQLSIPPQPQQSSQHHDPAGGGGVKSKPTTSPCVNMLPIITPPADIALGRTTLIVVRKDHVKRSTVDHLLPHPIFTQLNTARYVSFRFEDRTSLWTYSLCCDHLSNRLMGVYTDGDVRVIDLVS